MAAQPRFDPGNHAAERGTQTVMWITAAMMLVEISAGWWFNSMALLADGWHMSSHALAIGLSSYAYVAARRYASDARFAFGTWKIEVLGRFASAVFLLGVAALMVLGSVERFFAPRDIQYGEAMRVGVVGLVVNLVSAAILGRSRHAHDHDDHCAHTPRPEPEVGLPARTCRPRRLAIVALAGGWIYGWWWLDPAMGLLGTALVGAWARNLILETIRVLLDREMDHPVVQEIREVVESDASDTKVTDLHVWRVGRRHSPVP